MILPRNFNLEVDFWLATGATTTKLRRSFQMLPGWHAAMAWLQQHILWDMFSCSAYRLKWTATAWKPPKMLMLVAMLTNNAVCGLCGHFGLGLSKDWPFSLESHLMVVLSKLKFVSAACDRNKKAVRHESWLWKLQPSPVRLTTVDIKDSKASFPYAHNFFGKNLENVDEWVKSVKSAANYAGVWLVVCSFLPSFVPSFICLFVCLILSALLLNLLHCWLPVFSSGRDGSFASFSHPIGTFRGEMPWLFCLSFQSGSVERNDERPASYDKIAVACSSNALLWVEARCDDLAMDDGWLWAMSVDQSFTSTNPGDQSKTKGSEFFLFPHMVCGLMSSAVRATPCAHG